MLERDLLNTVREFEEEGEKILKDAEEAVKVLREKYKKKMQELKSGMEEKLNAEIENYRSVQFSNLRKEIDTFKANFLKELENLEKQSELKAHDLLQKYTKEVLDYGNREG
jgi:vacuolar-type H+-ATPase subunit H